MTDELLSDVLARLEAEESLAADVSDLVLAALMGDVEGCLGGERPERPASEKHEERTPVRAYVDSLKVRGFRGIGGGVELSFTPGPGLTLVVGRNGSGKSSFAEALELLLTGDNQRWGARKNRLWKDGWRNLHHADGASIGASLLVDGESGACLVERHWEANEPLEEGTATVTRGGATRPIAELGWQDALATYRPFLSYNELGSMLEEGPSKLFDALASILGLEAIVRAADALKEARARRTKAHKSVRDGLEILRSKLEAHGDAEERAARCLAALKGKAWRLDVVESVVTGGRPTGEDVSALSALRELARLDVSDGETTSAVVAALRAAAEAADAVAGTDAERARRTVAILEGALSLHEHHGDGDCPVCGREAALDADWRSSARGEADQLAAEAAEAEAAERGLRAAEQAGVALITPAPATLTRAADADAGVDTAPLSEAWRRWLEGRTLRGIALAEHIEAHASALEEEVATVRKAAEARLGEREDRWKPLARELGQWLPGAVEMQGDADVVKRLKAAEDWTRQTALSLRNERFQPIKEDVKAIWTILRTQSNVDLEDVTFEGKTTARHVNLEVTVDGTESAALGVMSQGELHSLALSLFLPRATLDASPFGFLFIDDPVQSMDPARVDGLARVLDRVAKTRQVVVFTHDDRLPEAVRRLRIEATMFEVQRQTGSAVSVRELRSPAEAYLEDARALVRTEGVDPLVIQRVVPNLCRAGVESACIEVFRRRRLGRGESHADVEALILQNTKLLPRLALALFDDPDRASDVSTRIGKTFGPSHADVVHTCNKGAHGKAALAIDKTFVRNVHQLVEGISKQK